MIKKILINLRNHFRLLSFQIQWRKMNRHNLTEAVTLFPADKVKVGRYSYGDLRVRCFHDTPHDLTIGSFCSIASNVVFLLCAEHDYKRLTTYPLETFMFHEKESGKVSKGNIRVEDDVWIGENCTILSGVTIGQGAIVSAGSIVVKDIPPYAIYGNYKILAYRFAPELIAELIKLDFGKFDQANLEKHRDFFRSELTIEGLHEWVKAINEGSSPQN